MSLSLPVVIISRLLQTGALVTDTTDRPSDRCNGPWGLYVTHLGYVCNGWMEKCVTDAGMSGGSDSAKEVLVGDRVRG